MPTLSSNLLRNYFILSGLMDMSGAGKAVCVTGASGFIASWLVKLLLQRGYTVNATVRDTTDPNKTRHLLALDGAKERLHLFKANLLQESSFDAAIRGCDGVFHTASPVILSPTDPQAELIDPAVNGTINVLRSCVKHSSSVKRVVVTSSLTSVRFTGKPMTEQSVVDETWFSDPVVCRELELWYTLSKTLAEQAAWKLFSEEMSVVGIELVTVNPGLVIGPLLRQVLNFSVAEIVKLVNGARSFHNSSYKSIVDVRDVAKAHVLAFEVASASGRYCLVERVAHSSEILNMLLQLCPTAMEEEEEEGKDQDRDRDRDRDEKPPFGTAPFRVSVEKAKGLGIEFMPLEISLKDTVESLKEKKLLS